MDDAVSDDEWPGAEDLRQQMRAQLALEARFPGWQVLHAMNDRWVRYVRIPEGSFYAVHDRLGELPLCAPDLEKLAARVEQRQDELRKIARWVTRSDLTTIIAMIRRLP
ncbi:hypothetical protein Axi01nite_87230 [Actinoplanes xinjiangensis]|nr:hypothetical protein Axi01nite_87230 [Actinoplanes xinjiangensis]